MSFKKLQHDFITSCRGCQDYLTNFFCFAEMCKKSNYLRHKQFSNSKYAGYMQKYAGNTQNYVSIPQKIIKIWFERYELLFCSQKSKKCVFFEGGQHQNNTGKIIFWAKNKKKKWCGSGYYLLFVWEDKISYFCANITINYRIFENKFLCIPKP